MNKLWMWGMSLLVVVAGSAAIISILIAPISLPIKIVLAVITSIIVVAIGFIIGKEYK